MSLSLSYFGARSKAEGPKTVRPKLDGLALKWTVPDNSEQSFEQKRMVNGQKT